MMYCLRPRLSRFSLILACAALLLGCADGESGTSEDGDVSSSDTSTTTSSTTATTATTSEPFDLSDDLTTTSPTTSPTTSTPDATDPGDSTVSMDATTTADATDAGDMPISDTSADATTDGDAGADTMMMGPGTLTVRLEWVAPADMDPTDTCTDCGTDLDLHVAHGNAELDTSYPDTDSDGTPDPWFHDPLDCYSIQPSPVWPGSSPMLSGDDTHGVTGEIIGVSPAAPGTTYHIGVHYVDANTFGSADATITIRVDGNLLYGPETVSLNESDLWEVATITFPDAVVSSLDDGGGSPKVIPAYPEP